MSQFKDSEFMTAQEKEMVLQQWVVFLRTMVSSDLTKIVGADYGYFPIELEKAFTKRLYSHLSLSFGFIAHYNRLGFLSARFGSPEAIEETFRRISQGYGYGDMADLNKEMVKVLKLYRQRILGKSMLGYQL